MKRRGFFAAVAAALASPLVLAKQVARPPKKYMVHLVTDHGWRVGKIAYPTFQGAMSRLRKECRSYSFSYCEMEDDDGMSNFWIPGALVPHFQSENEYFRRWIGEKEI